MRLECYHKNKGGREGYAAAGAGSYAKEVLETMSEPEVRRTEMWKLLAMSGIGRHRRPDVPNSVLET